MSCKTEIVFNVVKISSCRRFKKSLTERTVTIFWGNAYLSEGSEIISQVTQPRMSQLYNMNNESYSMAQRPLMGNSDFSSSPQDHNKNRGILNLLEQGTICYVLQPAAATYMSSTCLPDSITEEAYHMTVITTPILTPASTSQFTRARVSKYWIWCHVGWLFLPKRDLGSHAGKMQVDSSHMPSSVTSSEASVSSSIFTGKCLSVTPT